MKDYIVRATAGEGTIRAVAAVTTNMVKDSQKVHGLSPLATVALGRTMTAAAMMSTTLKEEKAAITVQIKGDGPIGGIVVVSDSSANIKGYVHNPLVYLPLNSQGKYDVAGAVGSGYLNVIKDLGLKEPYIGYVDLVSGEIAEDITYYYVYSEQIPTVTALGVLTNATQIVVSSGGFILQLMPGADEETITFIENKINSIPPVSELLAQGKTPEEILEMILSEKDIKIIDKSPCRYFCNCSRERMERNILSLGKNEIMSLINENHGAEAQCHFCNEKYQFSEQDLLNLIDG
ncbi:Hsp33 family molecular chaperone HslO [Acetivibrio mesophilus]|uniref:33 kDa chaperonin n=1 Tax=Acetivibrio mesophilus TaxID=2487273 RepID=A0A4Q0I5B3_9FIRM|nr:Hsp33 family molecular chaperone HslO [Acetivibrio mesophilus]ODM26624.1 Hsp33 family molecular chaperone [Clostridium sp. Bc-iso-3]RXE58945.1 Hsp33 family molecular chaperone HslO [Acetivibrio mesophilus]HHV28499.1 Hsp33 family molecular chaperone HslO [Clostridium sp.]